MSSTKAPEFERKAHNPGLVLTHVGPFVYNKDVHRRKYKTGNVIRWIKYRDASGILSGFFAVCPFRGIQIIIQKSPINCLMRCFFDFTQNLQLDAVRFTQDFYTVIVATERSYLKMKKIISMLLAFAAVAAVFTGCSDNPESSAQNSSESAASFDTANEITVISREDGSGTRGAFIELFGVEEKDANGNKVDKTTKGAEIASKTDVVLTTVASNPYAIGYVSLGSLNDTVKALKIDGVEATTENVKNGSYGVARPFNIATKGEPTGLAKDFINFILSKEGQEVVSGSYIAVNDNAESFTSEMPTGKISIGGSSSVTPIMEKLIEAYKKINTGAEIELNQTDSTSGMTNAIDGSIDIGMASRELKDSEKAELTPIQIAIDGIAVVANPENTTDNLTKDQVKAIYVGDVTTWADAVK